MKSLTAAQRKAPAHELPKRSWRKSRELERYAKMEALQKKARDEPHHVAEEAVAKATGVHNPKGNGQVKNRDVHTAKSYIVSTAQANAGGRHERAALTYEISGER